MISILKELVLILDPFQEAIVDLQADYTWQQSLRTWNY